MTIGPGSAPPKPRRGLLIAIIALVVALILCGGVGVGGYLVYRASLGHGARTPADAVSNFLFAVFHRNDPAMAGRMVCSAARDQVTLTRKIKEIRAFDVQYKSPVYSWDSPTVTSRRTGKATLTTTVTMRTGDDRVAKQAFSFLTTNDRGWWVCDVGRGG
jgi:hypothetical protein